MLVEVLETFPSCVLDETAIPYLLLGHLRSWQVFRTWFSSDRWPVSGVGEHSRGFRVCGPLGLLNVLSRVVPSQRPSVLVRIITIATMNAVELTRSKTFILLGFEVLTKHMVFRVVRH
jgi:hypothetical protein